MPTVGILARRERVPHARRGGRRHGVGQPSAHSALRDGERPSNDRAPGVAGAGRPARETDIGPAKPGKACVLAGAGRPRMMPRSQDPNGLATGGGGFGILGSWDLGPNARRRHPARAGRRVSVTTAAHGPGNGRAQARHAQDVAMPSGKPAPRPPRVGKQHFGH